MRHTCRIAPPVEGPPMHRPPPVAARLGLGTAALALALTGCGGSDGGPDAASTAGGGPKAGPTRITPLPPPPPGGRAPGARGAGGSGAPWPARPKPSSTAGRALTAPQLLERARAAVE